uniref:Ig-like domain-containing protein n=1 Tax=Macrostomum lignano TaxID=282301 RepID=A0A1I8J132_9PLAT
NVRGLLPRSSGCRSQGSPGSCSWRRQTRSNRGRQQENQSNACYDDSVDDDTRRMKIPVSYCGEDAELCRSPTKEFIDAAEGSCKSSTTWDAQSIVSSHVGSNLLSKENDELLSVESEQQVDSYIECVLHNSATAAGGDDSLKIGK